MAADAGPGLELETLPSAHLICRFEGGEELPDWVVGRAAAAGALLAISRSETELSIVCAETMPPPEVERGQRWRALRVAGTLEHSLTGVLASLATPLAEAEIPIFAVSTFDTDYLLVPEDLLEDALATLAAAGHSCS